jgi:membrane protein implicated in regulation of membrane protease activity
MASLVLTVGLMFLALLLLGPIIYGLSFIKILPDGIIIVGSVASIAYGFYWLMLPIWPASLFGCAPLVFGFLALNKRVSRRVRSQSDEEE